jgi:hypothetical protein
MSENDKIINYRDRRWWKWKSLVHTWCGDIQASWQLQHKDDCENPTLWVDCPRQYSGDDHQERAINTLFGSDRRVSQPFHTDQNTINIREQTDGFKIEKYREWVIVCAWILYIYI